jgi:hypothetical protein
MKPEEIGDLLSTDSESVVVAREAALEQLATELDMDNVAELDEVRTRLAELPAEAWTGTAETERPNLKVVAAEPAEPPTKSRRSRLPLLLALLAVAAVALVIVLASSGTSEKPKTSAQSSAPAPSPPQKPAKPAKQPAPVAQKAQLAALGGASGATGTAALTQGAKRLTIDATGLPDGTYQVWLYNSVIDAVSLVKVRGTKLTLDLKLPSHASHYRYVDVSREPADGNPNHSGQSVLRVPLAKLSR